MWILVPASEVLQDGTSVVNKEMNCKNHSLVK